MTREILKQIRDRLHLVVPQEQLEGSIVASSLNERKGRLTIGCTKNVEATKKLLKLCAIQTIPSNSPYHAAITHVGSIVELTVVDHTKEKLHTADDLVKPLKVPFSAEYGENTYTINSPDSGTTFDVIRNEEVVETDCPTIAFALGKLQKHLLVDLSYDEELEEGVDEDVQNEIDIDFMKAIAEFMANSPVVNEEAERHLTIFMELLTNREFLPEEEQPEEDGE